MTTPSLVFIIVQMQLNWRQEMKKRILINLLLVSFFNYIGCYTYSALTDEEIKDGSFGPDKKIRLLLKNSDEIESSSVFDFEDDDNLYLKVDTVGHYLAGYGHILDKSSGNESEFRGIISHGIDSTKVYTINSENYSVFWTDDNKRLVFSRGNFIHVLPEHGVGYFISDPQGNQLKISLEEIEEVQKSKINWFITVPIIALSISLVVLFIKAGEGLSSALRVASEYSYK
jgi:hypothetical protein